MSVNPFSSIDSFQIRDRQSGRSLWVRFSALRSAKGFKKTAEINALFFDPDADPKILGLRRVSPIDEFSGSENEVRIDDHFLSDSQTQGTLSSRGRSIEWSFELPNHPVVPVPLTSKTFQNLKIFDNHIVTHPKASPTSGWVSIDGQRQDWKDAWFSRNRSTGQRIPHSWVWARSDSFQNDQGEPVDFSFEGLHSRFPINTFFSGSLHTPAITSFLFSYQGKPYQIGSPFQSLRSKSHHDLNQWKFETSGNGLLFRGTVSADTKDFAGLTVEDTNGSLLYANDTLFADATIMVYRNGKLLERFRSKRTALEVATRRKNPYVNLLV